MLERSGAYQAAIVASERRISIRASVDLIDPDIRYLPVVSSGEAPWSKSAQLHDKVFELPASYATLEPGRWLLDGSQRLIPDDPAKVEGQIGYVSDAISDETGSFAEPVVVELPFEHVDVLQAFSLYFPDSEVDGVPYQCVVSVLQSDGTSHDITFFANLETYAYLDGFTVYNPTSIRISVTKWSLPHRRVRIPEIVPGSYEKWDGRLIANLSVTQNGDVSCLSLPYNTCQLVLDNHDKRFEPRAKDSLFQSIEERQGIGIEIGVLLPDGNLEYKSVGIYYQKAPGWSTSDNGITITWDLVDIIGLIADRTYIPPEVLPATLEGWIASIVAQLGEKFKAHFHVDPEYAQTPVTVNERKDVEGKSCGDILRWACQASGTWPRAANDTGYLTVEPLWSEGGKVTLREIEFYPTMRANPDIAALIFRLYDGAETQIVVPGTSASSGDTKTISNPFIHTQAQALAAARMILSTYGGNRIETVGRGDPATEIGDVDTVWLDESSATTGRRIGQSFELQDGFLQNCKSLYLQANGAALFEEGVVLTENTVWTAPAGVTQLFVAVGQGGQGGMRGADGTLRSTDSPNINRDDGTIKSRGTYEAEQGAQGESGAGGKIWFGTININEQQSFDVQIGAGGAPSDVFGVPGAQGEETTFGPYSSEIGKVYPFGYTDLASGSSYGRTGVQTPLSGTSDGAAGGAGGEAGIGGWGKASTVIPGTGRKIYYTFWDPIKLPGEGKPGKAGASGFVLIRWNKDEVTA